MRSIVVTKKIKKGDKFTRDNLTTKRPFLPGNFHASSFYKVLGKKSKVNLDPDDFVKVGEVNE